MKKIKNEIHEWVCVLPTNQGRTMQDWKEQESTARKGKPNIKAYESRSIEQVILYAVLQKKSFPMKM